MCSHCSWEIARRVFWGLNGNIWWIVKHQNANFHCYRSPLLNLVIHSPLENSVPWGPLRTLKFTRYWTPTCKFTSQAWISFSGSRCSFGLLVLRQCLLFGIWKFCCLYRYFSILASMINIVLVTSWGSAFLSMVLKISEKSSILAFYSLQTIQVNFLSILSFLFSLIS